MSALEVDARGLRCPLPVIRLATAARGAAAGSRITVLATDPAARHDIPAWCRMSGNELLQVTELTEFQARSGTSSSLDSPGPPGSFDSPGPSGSSQPDPASEAVEPAYLRFVVLVRAQPAKAAGRGSERARRSTAR